MNQNNAIEVKNLKKKFKVYHDKGNMLKERVLHWSRNKYEERWVLNGISFEVRKGEAVGLIGHNGCGKSTTLKMLTKIMYPNSGTIELCGRVSSLLELGAGFHPDLSGRENIYINASIFGLTKSEIDRRAKEVIEFSELEEFIDNPVRTYSSGMYMRLAFSVAINVDAEILLIDEILGVGDANFQVKCFNKLMEIKNKGTTIVIVSHSLGQIEQICERSIWIHEGLIRAQGTPRSVHREYLAYMGELRNKSNIQEDNELSIETDTENQEKTAEDAIEQNVGNSKELAEQTIENQDSNQKQKEENKEEIRDKQKDAISENNANAEKTIKVKREDDKYRHIGSGELKIKKAYVTDKLGSKKNVFPTSQDIIINMEYAVKHPMEKVNFGVSIFRNDGVCCYGISTKDDDMNFFSINKDGSIKLVLKNVALLAGKYDVNIGIEDDIRNGIDYVDKICSFEIYTINEEVGAFYLDHKWELNV